MEITWRVISRGRGERGKKVQGVRSIIGRYKIDGEVKNSIGNGEAKELIRTTHGHELRPGAGEGGGDTGGSGCTG